MEACDYKYDQAFEHQSREDSFSPSFEKQIEEFSGFFRGTVDIMNVG